MEATTRSLIFGMNMRSLRDAAGLGAKEVAARFLNKSASFLYAVEHGERRLSWSEMQGLVCYAYQRPDALPQMEDLHSKIGQPDDMPIRDHTTMSPHMTYAHTLELMSTAAFGLILEQIPKLFQTREYMLAQHDLCGYDTDVAEGYAQAGIDRQQRFLAMNEPPMTRIITTESAMDRAVHVPGQLEMIHERSTFPQLELRVIPNNIGPHFSFSSFTVMHLGDFPPVLYQDVVCGGSLTNDSGDIAEASRRWNIMSEHAVDWKEFI